jgi:hypothetical protein
MASVRVARLAVIAAAVTITPLVAIAIAGVDYQTEHIVLPLVGRVQLGHAINALAVDQGLAIVGTDQGAVIVDTADPSQPRVRFLLASDEPVLDVAIDGDIVFLAKGDARLAVFDVTDPDAPQLKYEALFGDAIDRVAVEGDIGLVAIGATVHVVSSAHHQAFSTIEHELPVTDMVLMAGTAYIAGYEYWFGDSDRPDLKVVDVSDPARPEVVHDSRFFGATEGIAVSLPYVFLAQYLSGQLFVDTPAPPVTCEPGPCTRTPIAARVSTMESRSPKPLSTVPLDRGELVGLDLSNPQEPRRIGDRGWRQIGAVDMLPPVDVAALGERAFVIVNGSQRNSLAVYDVDGQDMGERHLVDTDPAAKLDARYLAATDGYLYVATGERELVILRNPDEHRGTVLLPSLESHRR